MRKRFEGMNCINNILSCFENQDEKLKQLDKLRDERKVIAEEAREDAPGQKANQRKSVN